ncbi:MAG TPA: hypothetical protein VGI10_09320 [Polyangiaceae bacterium]|jgi:hypothetical protein
MLARICAQTVLRAFTVVGFTLGALIASSCATGPTATGMPSAGIIQGHPKPGSSITHSQMCECTTCDPAKCCDGTDDAPASDNCTYNYDFDSNGCGISIQSCQSRCHQQIWRVLASEHCDDKRPTSCCG